MGAVFTFTAGALYPGTPGTAACDLESQANQAGLVLISPLDYRIPTCTVQIHPGLAGWFSFMISGEFGFKASLATDLFYADPASAGDSARMRRILTY